MPFLMGFWVLYISVVMTKNNNNEKDSMERYTNLSDFVDDDKPTDEMSFVYDSNQGEMDIDIKFRDGQADAFIDFEKDIDSKRDIFQTPFRDISILPAGDGNEVLALRRTTGYSEPKPVAELGLPISDERIDEFESRLDNHQDKLENWTQKAEAKSIETELKFEVVNHEYQTGWVGTKKESEIVLKPNKAIDVMTEEEYSQYHALCKKFDKADNYPICPARFDIGDVLTVDDIDAEDEVD